MELIVTKVERGIDRLERFKVDIDLAFLALGSDDFTTVDDQSVWWHLAVQLQPLLGRSDSRQDRQAVHARLDI